MTIKTSTASVVGARQSITFTGLDSSHLYCHPWQVRLSRLLQKQKGIHYSTLLALMLRTGMPFTKQYAFTVHASLHPNTLWYGLKLVDMLPIGTYNGNDFVGWYPANTYLLHYAPSLRTCTQLMQEDLLRGSEPFGALTTEDLLWNKAIVHLNWLQRTNKPVLDTLWENHNLNNNYMIFIKQLQELLLTVGSDRT